MAPSQGTEFVNDTDWQRVKEVLAQVLEHPREERTRALLAACGGDSRLLKLSRRLLDSYDGHQTIDDFLDATRATRAGRKRGNRGAGLDVLTPPPATTVTGPGAFDLGVDLATHWGEFVLLEELGHGGFGVVYRAWEPALKRELALKVMKPSEWRSREAAILRESRMLARLQHQNVVRLYGLHRVGDELAMAMEYVRGQTLADLVATRGPLTMRETAQAASALSAALMEVHRVGLVHRDVKASNVMRAYDGRIVLMDFGAGRELTREPNTSSGMVGTPVYMAPEVLAGAAATPAADVYSLGVLLFFLLTGRYPGNDDLAGLTGPSLRAHLGTRLPDVPFALVTAIARMLDPEPGRRPLVDAAMRRELNQLVRRPRSQSKDAVADAEITPQPRGVITPIASERTTARAAPPGIPRLADLTWKHYLSFVAGSILTVFLLGLLTTLEYNQVLGRHGGFATERVLDYLYYGVKSVVAPLVVASVVAIAAPGVAFLWRLVNAALPAITGPIRRRATRIRETLLARQLLTRTSAEQAVCLAGFACFVLILYEYRTVLAALTTSAETGSADVFAVLRQDNREFTAWFRLYLMLLLLALLSAGTLLRHLPDTERSRLARTGRHALMVVVIVTMAVGWRVMFGPKVQEVLYANARCFVIGQEGRRQLLHCPGVEAPRNRVVALDDPQVQSTGQFFVVFDGYGSAR